MLSAQQRRANRHTAWALVGLVVLFAVAFVVRIVGIGN